MFVVCDRVSVSPFPPGYTGKHISSEIVCWQLLAALINNSGRASRLEHRRGMGVASQRRAANFHQRLAACKDGAVLVRPLRNHRTPGVRVKHFGKIATNERDRYRERDGASGLCMCVRLSLSCAIC